MCDLREPEPTLHRTDISMNANLSIGIPVICIALLGLSWWSTTEEPVAVQPEKQFIQLVDNTLLDPLKEYKSGLVVLAFHETGSGYGDLDEMQLQEFLAEKELGATQVVKIDVNHQRDLARKYNVKSVPEFFVMKNGRIVYRDRQQDQVASFTSSQSRQSNRNQYQSGNRAGRTLAVRE